MGDKAVIEKTLVLERFGRKDWFDVPTAGTWKEWCELATAILKKDAERDAGRSVPPLRAEGA